MHEPKFETVCEFELNIQPTGDRGHGLKSHPTDWKSRDQTKDPWVH